VAFDITHYTNNSNRVRADDVDYAAFERRPLSPAALRTLR
jgi:hypothetical protein